MSLTKVSYSMIQGSPANVQDFGAKGDGVTNDTAAIQSAIDYVNGVGGGCVLLPYTTNGYLCTGNLILKAGVKLQGQNKTFVKFTSATTPNLGINGSNTCLFDLKLQGAAVELVALLGNTDNVLIDNCWLYDPAGSWTNILVHANSVNTNSTVISNSTLSGGKYGVLWDAQVTGNGLSVLNCHIYGNKCIELNTIATSGTYSDFKDTIISNNILNAADSNGAVDPYAIGIAKGNRVVIANNIIQDGYWECIHIEDDSLDIIIDGNEIIQTHAAYDGIQVLIAAPPSIEFPLHIVISNNIVRYNGASSSTGYGIRTLQNTANLSPDLISIQNNQVHNFSVGIQYGGVTRGDVSGNTVYACPTAIYSTVATRQIHDNTIVSCSTTGVGCTTAGIFGYVTFKGTLPSNPFGSTAGTIVDGFSTNVTVSNTGGSTQWTNICAAPSRLLGAVNAVVVDGSSRSSGIHDLKWDGTTSTTTNLLNLSSANFTSAQAQVAGGYLQIGFYSTGAVTNVDAQFEFKGSLII